MCESTWEKEEEDRGAKEVNSLGGADGHKKRNKDRKMQTNKPKEERRKREGGRAGVALHASHLIRRSRVCPVHVDVSLRASVARERQELPRA